MDNLRGFCLTGSLLLLLGCRQAYEPDAKFVSLYAELRLASLALHQDPERASEVRRVILAQHGMTPAEFHEQYMRLASQPEAWKPFQERVIARIDAFQKNPEGDPSGQ